MHAYLPSSFSQAALDVDTWMTGRGGDCSGEDPVETKIHHTSLPGRLVPLGEFSPIHWQTENGIVSDDDVLWPALGKKELVYVSNDPSSRI